MAKQQDLSLNPSKLSGLCGRLKCCLRYELPNAKGVRARRLRQRGRLRQPARLRQRRLRLGQLRLLRLPHMNLPNVVSGFSRTVTVRLKADTT